MRLLLSSSNRSPFQFVKDNFQDLIVVAIAIVAFPFIAVFPSQANPQSAPDRICPAQLQNEVDKIAKSPKLQASRIGVFVQTNEPNPQILANLDGDRLFIPASNAKIFTTAIALKFLGADYRFATRLMSRNLPNAKGEVENGLWLFATGDPSFSSAGLKTLVTQLKDKGVKQINGGLWTMTARKGEDLVGSWEWQDLQEYYAAKVSPFTINENALNWKVSPNKIGKPAIFEWESPELASDWRVENYAVTITSDAEYSLPENALKVVRPYGQKLLIISGQVPENSEPEEGGVAVPDPEAEFLRLLRQELKAQGITITAPDISKKLPPTQDLAISLSPPLSELITTTNKKSNNLYAELLLRALGDRLNEEITPDDSMKGGMIMIGKYLQSVNIPTNSVVLADGSGLSRRNLVTPRAIAQLLQSVSSDRNFRKSLLIAGVDGSLANRFKNTLAQDSLQAKTGTLTGVVALSGYAKPQNYREVIFSIMINNSTFSTRELQKYTDAIALLLTRLENCSDK